MSNRESKRYHNTSNIRRYGPERDRLQTFRLDRLRQKRHYESTYEALPYDATLALLFGVGYLIILTYGGQVLVGIMVLGMMIGYLLDILRITEATITVMWITIVVQIFALWIIAIQHMGLSIVSFFLLANTSLFQLLAAIWLTLHVRWVRKESTGAFLEEFLMNTLTLPTACVWCWGITSILGIHTGYYSMAVVLGALYPLVLRTPRPNLRVGKGIDDPKYEGPTRLTKLRRRRDKMEYFVIKEVWVLHTVLVPLFPVVTFISTAAFDHVFTLHGMLDMILLWSLSILPILLHLPTKDGLERGGFWWLELPTQTLGELQRFSGFVIFLIDVVSLQFKLVIRSIGTHLSFYDSHATVTHSLLIASAVLVLLSAQTGLKAIRSRGMFSSSTSSSLSRSKAAATKLTFQTCSSMLGLVWGILLGIRWYGAVLMAATGAIGAKFLVERKSWQVGIGGFVGVTAYYIVLKRWFGWLDISFMRISAHAMTTWLTVFAALASAFIGVSLSSGYSKYVTSLSWVVLNIGLSVGENVLAATNNQYESDVYPGYLIVLTSGVGVLVTNHLHRLQRIGPFFRCISLAIMGSKLSAVRFAGFWSTAISTFLILAALLSIFLAHHPIRKRLSPSMLLCHLVLLALGIAVDLDTWVRQPLHYLFQEVNEKGSISMQLAWIFIIILTTYLLGLAYHHKHESRMRRMISLSILFLGIFLLSKPGVEMELENASSTTFLLLGIPLKDWPMYLSLLSMGLIFIIFTSGMFLPKIITSVFVGVLLSISVSLSYLPSHFLVSCSLFFIIFTSTSVLLTTIHFSSTTAPDAPHHSANANANPRTSGGGVERACVVLLTLTHGMTYLLHLVLREGASEAKGILFVTHGTMCFLISLMVKAKSRYEPYSPFGVVGNLCVVMCTLSAWTVIHLQHESELAGLLLSPVFLLLNRDQGLLSRLNPSNRFCPVIAVAFGYLSFRSGYHLMSSMFEWSRPFDLVFILKNLCLTLCSICSVQSFISFLWRPAVSRDGMWLYLISPLNILPLLMGDLMTVRFLGAGAVAGSLFQIYQTIKLRDFGESRL